MNRSERLQLRLTPYEKAQIAARALEAEMKLSDYARHRLLGKRIAKPRRIDPEGSEGAAKSWTHVTQGLEAKCTSIDDEIRDMHD